MTDVALFSPQTHISQSSYILQQHKTLSPLFHSTSSETTSQNSAAPTTAIFAALVGALVFVAEAATVHAMALHEEAACVTLGKFLMKGAYAMQSLRDAAPVGTAPTDTAPAEGVLADEALASCALVNGALADDVDGRR